MRGRVTLRDLSISSGLPLAQVKKLRLGQGLGDPKALAVALGVIPSTVRRWKAKGVPVKRIGEVGNLVADIQAAAKAEAKERQRVKKLVTKARHTGIIPKAPRKGANRFGGNVAAGIKTISHLNRYLDLSALSEIEEAAKAAPKAPRYIITVSAVEAGITGKVRGYRGAFTQKLGKKAENIAFGSAITSGARTSRRAALEELFSKLKDAIDDNDSMVYLLDLTVFSYHYKDTELSRSLRNRRK